jgi:hypothetical protein
LIIGARADDFGTRFKGVVSDCKLWSLHRSALYMKEAMFIDYSGREAGLLAWYPHLDQKCKYSRDARVLGRCTFEDKSINKNRIQDDEGLTRDIVFIIICDIIFCKDYY